MSIRDRTSSDPFVRIYLDDGTGTATCEGDGADCLYQSRSKSKTINPKFNEHFRHVITDPRVVQEASSASTPCHFVLKIWDEDGMHGEDAMGQVRIPIVITNNNEATVKWYPVQEGGQGELEVKVEIIKE